MTHSPLGPLPRVLVADDDALVAKSLGRALGLRIEPKVVTQLDEARAQLTQAVGWDGFVFDLHFHGKPVGHELAAQARLLYPSAPVAVVTASSSRDDCNLAGQVGALLFLKPLLGQHLEKFCSLALAHATSGGAPETERFAAFAERHKLTAAEREVFLHACAGRAPAQFWQTHGIAEASYRSRVRTLLTRLGEESLAAAIIRALRETSH